MSLKKIKIDAALLEKATRCAEIAGYSSPEEFIQHALEKEVDRILVADEDEEKIKARLRGLGYLE